MRRVLGLTLAVFALGAADAAAGPCDPPAPKRPPSPGLLAQLGVLRAPAGPDDRAPREVRESEDRPYAGAMRRVPLAIGGSVWIVPLYDVSDRPYITEACIRTLPKRDRAELRRLKRATRGIERVEGLEILPYGADGESHGNATGSSSYVGGGDFVHLAGVDRDRRTRVVGLAPDGVASVRITLDDYRAGRSQRVAEVTAPVSENVFGVEVAYPLDLGLDEDVTFLDAAGAVVRPRPPR
jgi:hypothetical protein